jgi:hypothetical protein
MTNSLRRAKRVSFEDLKFHIYNLKFQIFDLRFEI